MNLVGQFDARIAKIFIDIGILCVVTFVHRRCNIVLNINMEERRLPMMSAVILLPSDLIVDALLRLQIRCRPLHIIIGVHLGERRHHKGLTDIQIDAAVTVQLMQPLYRGTEVAVVLPSCCSSRPRLAQTEDTRILCIKALLPLPIQPPIVAYITCSCLCTECREERVCLMFHAESSNCCGLSTNMPGTLEIHAVCHILLPFIRSSIGCPVRLDIIGTVVCHCPRIEIQAAFPSSILIV